MSRQPTLTDLQVEDALRGSTTEPSLAAVAAAIADARTVQSRVPEPPAGLIAQAASLARESSPKRAPARRPVRKVWRFAPAAVAASLLLVTAAPLAAVADTAAPQDLLYPVDRLLERAGIGDGGLTERLAEVAALNDRGHVDLAAHHLEVSVADATPAELAAQQLEVQEMVSELTASGPGVEASASLDDVAGHLPGNPKPSDEAPSNPNQGPGNNSGTGNENPGSGNAGNPNQGPGNNSGNQGTAKPSQGLGSNSSNQGSANPNQGPDNNSGNQGTNDNSGTNGSSNQSNNNSGSQGNQGDNPNKGPGKNSGNP